ncbi:MAG: heavy metal translocating P-type ATPase, partial [Oscillospiraceae bacterium]|nr:heavy metal translocating P-type ATPase [Oscillospiraceae bacterium]
MEQYNVTGMSCAACSTRIEKAVSSVPGVTSCAVSLLTNSMGVEGTASESDIIKAVENAGYGASKKGDSVTVNTNDDDLLKDTETPKLKKRLISSGIFLIILMYFSMGHMMWNFPAPAAFDNHVFLGVFEMLLAIIIMMINSKFFESGIKSLLHGSPNMDTLVALGSGTSFGYSLFELFVMILAQGNSDHETVMKYGMNLYFESAAMIPTLITVGKLLEAISKGRTTDALKGLIKLRPVTAVLYENGTEREVGISEVKPEDIFAV